MSGNLLNNASFENNVTQTYAWWKGWNTEGDEGAVCAYQKRYGDLPYGLHQRISSNRITEGGTYDFTLRVLSPTENATATPTITLCRTRSGSRRQEYKKKEKSFDLQVGRWQIVSVSMTIVNSRIVFVRPELYWGPEGAEIIIQNAYFGK